MEWCHPAQAVMVVMVWWHTGVPQKTSAIRSRVFFSSGDDETGHGPPSAFLMGYPYFLIVVISFSGQITITAQRIKRNKLKTIHLSEHHWIQNSLFTFRIIANGAKIPERIEAIEPKVDKIFLKSKLFTGYKSWFISLHITIAVSCADAYTLPFENKQNLSPFKTLKLPLELRRRLHLKVRNP